ncbi:NUC173 domain-containing protein [Sphaerosporella brunnea]|uniref:NUC173 domain-containing protein n=1 Tax=Sphaerosporella brunnea TaxID=1250544 RepID=A0A5J5ELN3_9PEZI|nr:NUC173 domain-containing protein [Sphaerosporella brunnea]
MATLEEKLDRLRMPRQKNQQQITVVLNAVEDILREQNTEFTPTAYFAALLSLLQQSISSSTILNKDLAGSTVYLLDLLTPYAPAPLLRAKFVQILTHLAPALTHPEAEAPLLRSSIGVLESLLVAQDGASWAIPQKDIGPRRAMAGLLNLGLDDRPKVRKRAQEALTNVLQILPPGPSLEHPASDMCCAVTLTSVQELMKASEVQKKKGGEHDPRVIHSLQLVKAVAAAGTWPSKRVEGLCESLLKIARVGNEFMTMAALGVFEELFGGLVDEVHGGKLEVVLEAISELRPSSSDSQLLPPWLAVIARGHEVYAQVSPDVAFTKLPALFELVASLLQSSAENIRTSSAQCLLSLVESSIPDSSLLDITRPTEAIFQKLAKTATDLLNVRYQGAWMEVFEVLSALFNKLRWRSNPVLCEAVKVVGELRSNEGFQGKKQADEVLARAVHAMGPDVILSILPLGLAKPTPGQPGRAWMLPVLRDSIFNTKLSHFREEMVPLSEIFFQKVVDFGDGKEKTVEIKIFETIVGQIWDLLPGYCDLPTDLTVAFDQTFAELLANVLYQKVELRSNICKALQNLVDSNKIILETEPDEDGDEDLVAQHQVTKEQAQKNLEHLAKLAGNMLAVLFNVYSSTLPQFRGFILKCLNSFLSITPHDELMATFSKVSAMLESSLAELTAQTQADKQKKEASAMPPMAHTLMDLVITITPYLPVKSYETLFAIFNATVNRNTDPQLQKKAYKVIPRLAETETGRAALKSQNEAIQALLIASAATATPPARRDRLVALGTMVEFIPHEDLHFIPAVLSEVVISAKEVNEKARTAAFEILVAMGEKMREGGVIVNRKVAHMPDDAPDAKATLEEYFTMVSAGLAGSAPHMVSASITALTRIMWQFKDDVDQNLLGELVSTLDLFLTSKNREIVRSVLGFIKVCIISLPKEMMEPRFKTLIPNLMVWSHEHKAHFKAKVKHIIERLIRRFGVDTIDRHTPEEDKKLITNIRKTRERRKRKKVEAKAAGEDGSDAEAVDSVSQPRRKNRFENEFDDALYGSESESDAGSDEEMGGAPKARKKAAKGGRQYIVEDEDEPLDLLDRKSLAHISTTRPLKPALKGKKLSKAKFNEDGKLILGDSDDEGAAAKVAAGGDDDMDLDTGAGGVDAYVEAVSGKNAYTRGQKGKVKFSNKRAREGDLEMELDDEAAEKPDAAGKGGMFHKKQQGGRGGFKKQMQGRRPLGQVREGRAGKSNRGRR